MPRRADLRIDDKIDAALGKLVLNDPRPTDGSL
jgi:hypothetical protein